MPDPLPSDRRPARPAQPLTSARNPRIRAAAALRDRRARTLAGLTLVDGVREIRRAIAGGATVVTVFVDEAGVGGEAGLAVSEARAAGAEVVEGSRSALQRLAYGDRFEGLVATVRIPDLSLAALRLPPDPLVVVAEGVEKPGNLGAILRSADAAGADAVVVADPRTDPFNPNAIRASLGTLFAVPVAASPSPEVRAWLAGHAIRPLAARVEASLDYTDADLRGPLALVLGSEAGGLTAAWADDEVTAVRLPMLGVADSLNVSVAAAVLLYEARRQRGGATRNTKPPVR